MCNPWKNISEHWEGRYQEYYGGQCKNRCDKHGAYGLEEEGQIEHYAQSQSHKRVCCNSPRMVGNECESGDTFL